MKEKGDFTAEFRLLWISALALVIGALCAVVALLLLWLIAFCTNLFYYQQVSLVFQSPADAIPHLGLLSIIIPVLGGLVVGLMARYGSDRIRGHGIPEAIEAILIGESRMQPKVALLKPTSSAIAIGSGGPFGAEGPIIMTGGAFGSIIAQVFHLTAAERKTLLVAGAAGGMTATFGTPVAAVLLAVELLLFEWKPRSLVPVAVAAATAALLRPTLPIQVVHGTLFQIRPGALFAVPPHDVLPLTAYLSSVGLGLICGAMSLFLTLAVYSMEDAFHRLPIHWMWWPAIGGLFVGIGGYFQPHALGVGYDIIDHMLSGEYIWYMLLGLMAVKGAIWATALGSGTSGGVLAPLFIMGGALGAVLGASLHLPGGDARLWPLVGMAAVMGGTMRAPLTGTLFALEVTHDVNTLPALLIACIISHTFTVLLLKRSILTEKVARRGYHISCEYGVDPLEMVDIATIMGKDAVTVPASLPVRELLLNYFQGSGHQRHQGYPVVDRDGNLLGVVTRSNLLEDWVVAELTREHAENPNGPVATPIVAYDLVNAKSITAFPWESCRTAAERMAAAGVGRLVVVSAEDPRKVVGVVTRSDLLKPRARAVQEEAVRRRYIALGIGTADGDKAGEARPTSDIEH